MTSHIPGTSSSISENSFQLYQAISAAATVICTAWIVTTKATSCTATRTLSMSDVIRLMMRPNLVLLKNDIGSVASFRNSSSAHVMRHRLAQFEREELAKVQRHHHEKHQHQVDRPHEGKCRAGPVPRSGR